MEREGFYDMLEVINFNSLAIFKEILRFDDKPDVYDTLIGNTYVLKWIENELIEFSNQPK